MAAVLVLVLVPALVLLALSGVPWGRAAAQVVPSPPEGAVQTVQSVSDFDSYALPVGPFRLDAPAVRDVDGAVARSAWRLDDPKATVAGVMQGYRERLQALGFEPVFECAGEACGGFDFRFGAEILPPPEMLVDVRDFAQLSAARAEPEGYVSVLVSRVLESIYVQTVSVAAAPGPAAQAAPETPAAPGGGLHPGRAGRADGRAGPAAGPGPAAEAAAAPQPGARSAARRGDPHRGTA